jgi:hypothetical protein
MQAIGKQANGVPVTFSGHTASELERAANALGAVYYWHAVDGGRVAYVKLGNKWIAL